VEVLKRLGASNHTITDYGTLFLCCSFCCVLMSSKAHRVMRVVMGPRLWCVVQCTFFLVLTGSPFSQLLSCSHSLHRHVRVGPPGVLQSGEQEETFEPRHLPHHHGPAQGTIAAYDCICVYFLYFAECALTPRKCARKLSMTDAIVSGALSDLSSLVDLDNRFLTTL